MTDAQTIYGTKCGHNFTFFPGNKLNFEGTTLASLKRGAFLTFRKNLLLVVTQFSISRATHHLEHIVLSAHVGRKNSDPILSFCYAIQKGSSFWFLGPQIWPPSLRGRFGRWHEEEKARGVEIWKTGVG